MRLRELALFRVDTLENQSKGNPNQNESVLTQSRPFSWQVGYVMLCLFPFITLISAIQYSERIIVPLLSLLASLLYAALALAFYFEFMWIVTYNIWAAVHISEKNISCTKHMICKHETCNQSEKDNGGRIQSLEIFTPYLPEQFWCYLKIYFF